MNSLPFGRLTNGWFIPPPTIGDPKTDYKIRAIVARVGLTANTPKEAVYLDGMLDSDREPLTGAKRYTMTFQKSPPYIKPAFWALRMFDATNSYPVPNPLNRYVLGSDYPDMKYNADGSLTIYLQADKPGEGQGSELAARASRSIPRDPGHLRSGRGADRNIVEPKRLHSSACGDGRNDGLALSTAGALPVDMAIARADVRYRHKADIPAVLPNARFWGNSGHQ
jgi:hypothetical protein